VVCLQCDGSKPSSTTSSITLPELSESELKLLNNGEIIQGQKRDGSAGTGWVVMDVDACPHRVFSSLVDFERCYQTNGVAALVFLMVLYYSNLLNLVTRR